MMESPMEDWASGIPKMKSDDELKDLQFYLEDVKVVNVGPVEKESGIPGIILILREPHGYVVQWHPSCLVKLRKLPTPGAENSEWEDVSVGYTAAGSGCVTIQDSVKKNDETARIITLEISEMRSFKKEEISGPYTSESEVIATFYLKDGSTPQSFHFKNDAAFSEFVEALKKHLVIERSKSDSSLFLIKRDDGIVEEKSFSQLQLSDGHTPLTSKIMKNPVETALESFSKVTSFFYDYVLFPNENVPHSDYQESLMASMDFIGESLPRVDIDLQEEPGYGLITCIQMPPRQNITRETPVTLEEWNSYFDNEGRVKNAENIRRRIFKGGLEEPVRSLAWPFLLGYFKFDSTEKERDIIRKNTVDYYYEMKYQWKRITRDQESRFSAFRERRSLIEKDVSRTDRTLPFYAGEENSNIKSLNDILMTYCMYNFDLGYVQGMSDLLSPILVILGNEPETFWCFANWMNTIGANFEMEQQGIKTQLLNLHRLIHFVDSDFCAYLEKHESGNLFFAFKWLLILFKRDFRFHEIMRLWEVLWTNFPCKNFHLLVCVAILDTEKTTIVENCYGLTEILKHINDMAYKINLEETLCKAEAIYQQIISCSHLSDTIQEILGIEPSTEQLIIHDNKVNPEFVERHSTKDSGPGIAVQIMSCNSSCEN